MDHGLPWQVTALERMANARSRTVLEQHPSDWSTCSTTASERQTTDRRKVLVLFPLNPTRRILQDEIVTEPFKRKHYSGQSKWRSSRLDVSETSMVSTVR